MRSARLLALDWGTSSLRAHLLGERGTLLAERQQPWGIMHLPEGGFDAALQGIAADWLEPGLPMIASGMVGSAQGWREAPYVDLPAGAATLAHSLTAFDVGSGLRLHIVPGVRHARPDVMRGEETQCIGALGLMPALASRSTLLLPGTHSKWLRLETGRIVDFQTFMTGELYALLAEHSILGRPARAAHGLGETAAPEAFDRGVAAVRTQGAGGASELMFTTRALVLAGRLNAADSLEYLSGLLIGEELRCALGTVDVRAAPLALIGDAALCQRYRRALALWQVLDVPVVEAAAAVGLWRIATQAALVSVQ